MYSVGRNITRSCNWGALDFPVVKNTYELGLSKKGLEPIAMHVKMCGKVVRSCAL
ncbi:MAG: hypothetical protein ACK55Z_22165 [bacterium]